MKLKKYEPINYLIPLSVVFVMAYILISTQLFKESTVINIGLKWLHQSQFAGYYVAEKEGYYKQNNIQVNFYQRNPEENNVDQVVSGKLHFAIVSSGELLKAIDSNKPVIALFALYQKTPAVIVSLKEKNITTPRDLENKNLGLTSSTIENQIMYTALAKDSGIDPKTLRFTSTGFNQIEFLLTKKVDAVSLYRTSGLPELLKQPQEYNIIYPENFGYNSYDDILITNTNFLENNKEIVKKFVKASASGWDTTIKHPEIGISSTLSYMDSNTGHKETQQNVLKQSIPLIKESPEAIIGKMSDIRWQEQANLLSNEGIIKKQDISNVFTNKYLE